MRFLPYAQLLRIPNVFTALADVALGIAAALGVGGRSAGDPWLWASAALLLLATACLYCGGMVWNDYFDFEEDRRDRPFRPLPSGRVAVRTAFRLGVLLLGLGAGFAALSGFRGDGWDSTPAVLGGAIVVAVLLYDARLKRTAVGPVAMGLCRFLNVLLGLSLADEAALPWPARLHVASAVGLYIVGVTWFARTEAGTSSPRHLQGAAGVMLAALGVALAAATRVPPGTSSPLFPYLLVAFAFFVGAPVVRAIEKPEARRVQAAVKRCILGLVGLDALLATVFAGTAGLAILLLLPPAFVVGKWVYST